MRSVVLALSFAGVMLAQDFARAQRAAEEAAKAGRDYLQHEKYAEAVAELERAVSLSPVAGRFQIELAEAYLGGGKTEKGLAILSEAVDEKSSAASQNEIAYWLAVHGMELDRARRYAQTALLKLGLELGSSNLEHITPFTFRQVLAVANCWDTLGWIEFQRGNLDKAEKFLNAAWVLAQGGFTGDHLGQLFAKAGRKQEAIHAYASALAADPLSAGTRSRLASLVDVGEIEPLIQAAHSDLTASRNIQLGKVAAGKGRASFFLELEPVPAMPKAKFVGGDEMLRKAGEALQSVPLPGTFPSPEVSKLFRMGEVTCAEGGDCTLQAFPAFAAAQAEALSNGGGAKINADDDRRLLPGPHVTAPVPVHQVQPKYTEAARQARLEGTVELYIEVKTDGHPRNIRVLRGLGMGLDEEAIKAVEQWEFRPGEKEGKPVIVSATVNVNFELKY